MATNKRSIGGDGLEQGGANPGNNYNADNNNTTAGGSQVLPNTNTSPEDVDSSEDDHAENSGNENSKE